MCGRLKRQKKLCDKSTILIEKRRTPCIWINHYVIILSSIIASVKAKQFWQTSVVEWGPINLNYKSCLRYLFETKKFDFFLRKLFVQWCVVWCGYYSGLFCCEWKKKKLTRRKKSKFFTGRFSSHFLLHFTTESLLCHKKTCIFCFNAVLKSWCFTKTWKVL